jgi:phenylpropionate dioxygenase-like ring-hydroxylating dioxygenase large terminal subunit
MVLIFLVLLWATNNYPVTPLYVGNVPKKKLDFFKNWHCLGVNEHIDFSKPYKINVGDLPLVVWKNPLTQELTTTINICDHMGSKLDNGIITEAGCLKCQYHGKEFSNKDKFGETMLFEDKIFWSYDADRPSPYSVPFYNNQNYEKSILTIDMKGSLLDSAMNMMDIRHPEYVHKFGFGSINPPTNIHQYLYKNPENKLLSDKIGLSFDYQSNMIMRKMNNNAKVTNNFHIFMYPVFSWSRVSFDHKHLIIAVNMLPLGTKKTRWFVTICYNYYTTPLQKKFLEMMAHTILNQDYIQMENQHPDDRLKMSMLLDHTFPNEEVLSAIRVMFNNYQYPTIEDGVDLYKDHKMKQKIAKLREP